MEFPLYRPPPPPPIPRYSLPVVTLVVAAALAVSTALGAVAPVEAFGVAPGVGSVFASAVSVVALLAVAFCESRGLSILRRRRAERRQEREADVFDADLRDALERERRAVLRRARSGGGLIVGYGAVESEVRVVGEGTRLVQEGAPLVVLPPAEIRVLGPPALADVVRHALATQARRLGRPLRPTRHSAVARVAQWAITSAETPGPGAAPRTELWLAPDGSACVRSPGQAGGAWVPCDPWLG